MLRFMMTQNTEIRIQVFLSSWFPVSHRELSYHRRLVNRYCFHLVRTSNCKFSKFQLFQGLNLLDKYFLYHHLPTINTFCVLIIVPRFTYVTSKYIEQDALAFSNKCYQYCSYLAGILTISSITNEV